MLRIITIDVEKAFPWLKSFTDRQLLNLVDIINKNPLSEEAFMKFLAGDMRIPPDKVLMLLWAIENQVNNHLALKTG